MIHRVIPLGDYPTRFLDHVRAAGCSVRCIETAWRGSVAFVGQGRVWAVAELTDVKPATRFKGKDGAELPQGYIWCFQALQDVGAIDCPPYGVEAMFLNGEELEPQLLAAGTQAELNRALGIEEAVAAPEDLEPAVIRRAPTDDDYCGWSGDGPIDYVEVRRPTPKAEEPIQCEVGERGQLGMVF